MQIQKSRVLFPTLMAALALASCRQAPQELPPAEPAPQAAAAAAPKPQEAPPANGEFATMAAVCNIESIDSQSGEALEGPVRTSGSTSVSGWRALLSSDGAMAPAWLRATRPDGSVAFQAVLPATEDRPDVAALAGQTALRSGFRSVAIEGLPPGTFGLEIVFSAADGWVRCAHQRTLLVE